MASATILCMNTEEKQHQQHSAFADYFKEIIYGGIDGIVTTFAVVAGFTGAALSTDMTTQMSFLVVLLFGLANLFADAASMGLGNFLSVRSEKDLYNAKRKNEVAEVRNNTEYELSETIRLMQAKGFSETDAATMANIYKTNEDYWVDFMMTHEQELSDPRGENEVFTGLATFFSFMIFGAVPLLPFLLQSEGNAKVAFLLSSAGTMVALVSLGLLKWRVIGTNLMPSLFEVVSVGTVAAGLAFFVGTFFSL